MGMRARWEMGMCTRIATITITTIITMAVTTGTTGTMGTMGTAIMTRAAGRMAMAAGRMAMAAGLEVAMPAGAGAGETSAAEVEEIAGAGGTAGVAAAGAMGVDVRRGVVRRVGDRLMEAPGPPSRLRG
jgi:hypothetical protein